MLCDKPYKHEADWCDTCWEQKQEAKALEVQGAILRELKRANDLKEWALEQDGSPRPQRTYYNPPKQIPVTPPPIPAIKRRGL